MGQLTKGVSKMCKSLLRFSFILPSNPTEDSKVNVAVYFYSMKQLVEKIFDFLVRSSQKRDLLPGNSVRSSTESHEIFRIQNKYGIGLL